MTKDGVQYLSGLGEKGERLVGPRGDIGRSSTHPEITTVQSSSVLRKTLLWVLSGLTLKPFSRNLGR